MQDRQAPVKRCMRDWGAADARTAPRWELIEAFTCAAVRVEFVKGPRQIDRDQGRPAAARPWRTMDRGVEDAIRQAPGHRRLS
jgi:hypothetical protein